MDMDTLLGEMAQADPLYAPTNFWQPGVKMLSDDLRNRDFATFKTWPSCRSYFFQDYGQGYAPDLVNELWKIAEAKNKRATRPWLDQQLLGFAQAHHDLDIAMARWNQTRWPFDFRAAGESDFGGARERTFALLGATGPRFSRTYLSYLKVLAELSNHMDGPPRSVLEIGGGYGTLAEIILARDPNARYVDVDIPPTLIIAGRYIGHLFKAGSFVPSWRIAEVEGPFDLFVNAYSFQEMEPAVVANYIARVADLKPTFAVSLNSRAGKPKATEVGKGRTGVIEPVVSDFIRDEFARHGYGAVAAVGRPFAPPQAELLIMRR